ncbi:hypothetical protein MHBO_000886 [Bonamia ostreae]|uniref:Uncharacterized protein n=1 Tax=Bonamia ostreae TaxID=126728 RepID=A0ABV2AH68_9EUKA
MDTNKRSLLHPRVSVLNAKNLTAPKTNNVLEQKNHLKTKLAIDTKNLSKKTKRTRLTKIASKSKIIKRGLFNLSTSRLREVIKSIDQEKKELEGFSIFCIFGKF